MRGKDFIDLFRSPKIMLAACALFVALMAAGALPAQAVAKDVQLAANSPLTGIVFDDRPVPLAIQRNFQMAMLTAGSQIGRSCSKMESYGWRMAQSEQYRLNQIFDNTVNRLHGLGYTVEAQTPHTISKDITLFTADRRDKHFLFMWSAGEVGLVLVLCESSPPLTGRMAEMYNTSSAIATSSYPQEVVQTGLDSAAGSKGPRTFDPSTFTPIGDWIGDYTCMRGYTGATMHIDKFKGEDFQGTFRFYPTPKNPYVAKGSYAIYGQYDKESKRILINPGKWLEHPNGYYKTIIIGSFDPVQRTFSGFFQGIMGCTSFEAKSDGKNVDFPSKKPARKHVKPKKKKVVTAPPLEIIKNPTPDEALAPMTGAIPPATGDVGAPEATKAAPPAVTPAATDAIPPASSSSGPAAVPVAVPSMAPEPAASAPATPSPAVPTSTAPLPIVPATPSAPSSQAAPPAPAATTGSKPAE